MNPEFDERFRQLLKSTPNMMVNGRGMLEFTCFQCKPKRTFPDLEGHRDHCLEIHNTNISYKNLLMVHVGPGQSNMMGLDQKTETEIIDLINRFDANMARRSR